MSSSIELMKVSLRQLERDYTRELFNLADSKRSVEDYERRIEALKEDIEGMKEAITIVEKEYEKKRNVVEHCDISDIGDE